MKWVCLSIHQMPFNMSASPAQELKPLCIIQGEVMQCGNKEEGKRIPLPSVAASNYKSLGSHSLTLTSSAADYPQITGSYFIISCWSVPRPSSPLSLGDMWKESKEESERYWRSRSHTVRVEKVYSMRDRGVNFCWKRKRTYFSLTEYDCSQKISSHEYPGHPSINKAKSPIMYYSIHISSLDVISLCYLIPMPIHFPTWSG